MDSDYKLGATIDRFLLQEYEVVCDIDLNTVLTAGLITNGDYLNILTTLLKSTFWGIWLGVKFCSTSTLLFSPLKNIKLVLNQYL